MAASDSAGGPADLFFYLFWCLRRSWESLGALLGLFWLLLAHFWSLLASLGGSWSSFGCLWSPLTPLCLPKQTKTNNKIVVFGKSPKSLRGCVLAHYWSLWLSFWLPLAPFWCLRDPLWCPKGLKMTPWAFILGEIRVTRTVRVPRWVPGPQKDNF